MTTDDAGAHEPGAAPADRFQGTADQGGYGRQTGRRKQLTEADLSRMSPEDIAAAEADGLCDDLLGRNLH